MSTKQKFSPSDPKVWDHISNWARQALKTAKATSKDYTFTENILKWASVKAQALKNPKPARTKTTFRWQCLNPKCGKIHDKAEMIRRCPSCKSQDIEKLVDEDDQEAAE